MGMGVHGHFLADLLPLPPKSRYPVYTILGGPQRRSWEIWISKNLVFPPGFQLRTVQPVTSDYRLRPPGPTYMHAYSNTLDPNIVRDRRYWSRYWDWRSLKLALVTHKISTVMTCGSLRFTFLGGSELRFWPGMRYSVQVFCFHNSELHSGKYSWSCHVCPYHHHIFSAYHLCNWNFFLW
jgi:hypothetical protein